jgi:hypothetical protein
MASGAGPNRVGFLDPTRLLTERATNRDSLRDIKPQCHRERKFMINLDASSSELAVMNSPGQDTIIRAVEDARRILGEYI